jgi:hypothetical protein
MLDRFKSMDPAFMNPTWRNLGAVVTGFGIGSVFMQLWLNKDNKKIVKK